MLSLSHQLFQPLGKAAQRVPPDATAFSYREALCEWAYLSSWPEPAADEVNICWARELWEVMRPFTIGGDYINQMGLEAEEGADRIRAAYGPNYQRLVALKNRYDPTNLFRCNQNIKPTA